MDHSMHAEPEAMCSMNMLFNWKLNNLCIVFHWWHLQSTASIVVSLIAIVLLGLGYEALRNYTKSYELASGESTTCQHQRHDDNENNHDRAPLIAARHPGNRRVKRAILYALQVFYSYFLMLVFMTYNGWIMISVAFGAFLGYLIFGSGTAVRGMACH